MKEMVYACDVNKREEFLQRVLNAARLISNAAMVHNQTRSLIIQVSECIQADAARFEEP
jgi:hypothetical protein